jgi:hypothetical protein
MTEAQKDVRMWLELVIRACQREIAFVEDTGDIADGEIQSPWNLLQLAIGRLRDEQRAAKENETLEEATA